LMLLWVGWKEYEGAAVDSMTISANSTLRTPLR
jgi:hypothetical protein